MTKVALNIVTFNGARYLPALFASLKNQTFKDWDLFILDNASTDNTVAVIEAELKTLTNFKSFIKSKNNLGFCGGYNQLYQANQAEYSVLMNQDLYLAPDCLEKLVTWLEKNPTVPLISPRLMRWDFTKFKNGNEPASFTQSVDALGLKVLRNRRVVEWYAGLDWLEIKKIFTTPELNVFGVSGTLPVLNRNRIKPLLLAGEKLFDENLFMYKEDVDLSYRVQQAGLSAYVILDAVAYHDRTASSARDRSDLAAAKNKSGQSAMIKKFSYRNHLWILVKNEYWQNFALDCPFILWYELKKFVYLLIFDPKSVSGLKGLWQKRSEILSARRANVKCRQANWRKIRRFFKQ